MHVVLKLLVFLKYTRSIYVYGVLQFFYLTVAFENTFLFFHSHNIKINGHPMIYHLYKVPCLLWKVMIYIRCSEWCVVLSLVFKIQAIARLEHLLDCYQEFGINFSRILL